MILVETEKEKTLRKEYVFADSKVSDKRRLRLSTALVFILWCTARMRQDTRGSHNLRCHLVIAWHRGKAGGQGLPVQVYRDGAPVDEVAGVGWWETSGRSRGAQNRCEGGEDRE